MMSQKYTNKIPFQIFCPDCGATRPEFKVNFYGHPMKRKNTKCKKCSKKIGGYGYDWRIEQKIIDSVPWIYFAVTSSGIENRWKKQKILHS